MKLTNNQSYYQLDKANGLPTFRRFPIVFERGEGARLWDIEGKEYIDALAGIAVNNVGHAHPKVVNAIQEQVANVMHVSNFFMSRPQVELGQRLIELSGLNRVFFSNSGAEANEGAIKIARKYAQSKGKGFEVISMVQSFHGRTIATIATGKKSMQEGFGPMPEGFKKVAFNDFEDLKNNISEKTAAIILEPVQGEGGIYPADHEYLHAVRKLCDEQNIVLIFDEIQCGIGRTGKWFAKEHAGVQPDIMTLAKGLGGGLPIGAILCNEKVSQTMKPGDHGTTFGGNAVACASALAVLEVIEEENLLEKTLQQGEWLKEKIQALNLKEITDVRGIGLMIGIQFNRETRPLMSKMLDHGVIANATAGDVLRLVPPLVISNEDLEKVLEVMVKSVDELRMEN